MHKGMTRDNALLICGVTKNQFYHCPSSIRQGRRCSEYTTRLINGVKEEVSNLEVVEWIKRRLKDPLNTEGYQRMTGALQLSGFYINAKKVYRLMRKYQLLRKVRQREGRNYVRYRILCPATPLRLIEMDIKSVWIAGKRRYAYVLTILDVFTRVVLCWRVGLHMKQEAVQAAWQELIETHLEVEHMHAWKIDIEVRNDNGPQFSSKKMQQFLKDNYFLQTFTHPYTPQENGHVESFHAILGDQLQGKVFVDLAGMEDMLDVFYVHYNQHRIHGSTLNLPPQLFWNQWKAGNIERTVIDEKKRKVKFRLKIGRQNILNNKEPEPVGIRNPERGRVSDVEESIHENSECTKKKKQADSTVLFVKSEV